MLMLLVRNIKQLKRRVQNSLSHRQLMFVILMVYPFKILNVRDWTSFSLLSISSIIDFYIVFIKDSDALFKHGFRHF